MSIIAEEKHRQVIPRWRSYKITAELGELGSLSKRNRVFPIDQFYQEKLRDWATFKTISYAADFVCAAFVFERPGDAIDAAEFLLENAKNVPTPALHLAVKLLNLMGAEEPSFVQELIGSEPTQKLRADLHRFRARLKNEPRNALLWAEMARNYTILGSNAAATKAMRIALALEPQSRFVLRSAARLKLHFGELDQAHELLRRNDATRADPWLIATEIAIAGIVGRRSRNIKLAREMLRAGKYSNFDVSELASSLATLEVDAGDSRSARKLFRTALLEPNENSVAQAEWAAKCIGSIDVGDADFKVPRTFEAKARRNFQSADWKESLREAWSWFFDQPFSKRPASFGSYVAGVYLEDYKECEKIARAALDSNPHDPILLNNIAFACASDNRPADAQLALDKIKHNELNLSERIAVTATKGLVQYRNGKPELGRQLYLEALDLAKGSEHLGHRVLAAFFLVREETLAKTAESVWLRHEVIAQMEPIKLPELVTLRNKLLKSVVEAQPQIKPIHINARFQLTPGHEKIQ